jgi:serine/threonine-protein kinase
MGQSLSGAVPSHEVGYVELRFETSFAVVAKVERLLFESFPEADDWAYFRLECAPIPPSGTYESVAGRFEELLELSPGEYYDRRLYEQGFVSRDPNSGEPITLPKSARVVSRLFGGAFVVFAKASGFNAADSYQGMHDRLSTDQFRHVIAEVVKRRGK